MKSRSDSLTESPVDHGVARGAPPSYALFGAAMFILVSVGRIQELWPPLYNLPLARISLMIILLGYLFNDRDPNHKIRGSRIFTPLASIVFLCGLSVFWSVWQGQTFDVLKDLLLPIVVAFFLLIKLMPSLKNVHQMIRVISLAGAILATVTITNDWAGRLEVNSSYDPNDLALMLVTILPLTVFEGACQKGRSRLVFFVFAGISVLAILLTQSRGGFLALIAVGALMALIRYDDANNRLRFAVPSLGVIAGLLVAMLLIWAVLPNDGKERLLSVFDLSSDYNMSHESGRMAIWGRAIGFVADRPWGSGFGTSSVADGLSGGRFKATHNSFIQTALELGVQGLFLYLLVIFRSARMLKQWAFTKQPEADDDTRSIQFWSAGLMIGLVGFCVSGFFLSQAYSWILIIILCLVVGLELAVNRKQSFVKQSAKKRSQIVGRKL